MDTTTIEGHVQPPAHWGSTEYSGVKQLKELHAAAQEADENVETIKADVEAITTEIAELEQRGNREGLTRLIALETKKAALKRLLPAAEDSAEVAWKRLYAASWGAWDQLSGRAARLREELIAERVQKLRENPVIQSTSLSRNEVAGMVGAIAEAWAPLRKLHINRDVDWKRAMADYVAREKFIAAAEKNPGILEDEPEPSGE